MSPLFALSLQEKMPEMNVKMKNVDGKELTLAQIKGMKNATKGTLVVFTCNHCPYAQAWWDRMVTLGNEYSKKGIAVVAINSNDPQEDSQDDFEHMKAAAIAKPILPSGKASYANVKMDFPYVIDSTSNIAKSFGASKTPEFFFFNNKDALLYHGAIDSDAHDSKNAKPFLKIALNDYLSGKRIAEAEPKALGCMIRFRSSN